MIPAFDIGDLVRLGNQTGDNDDGSGRDAFTDQGGDATDPAAVVLEVQKPDGTTLEYGYPSAGTDGTLQHPATGRFYFDVNIDQSGRWLWSLSSSGTVITAERGQFWARRSAF